MSSLVNFWYWPVPAERLAITRVLVGAFSLLYLMVHAPELLGVVDYLPAQFVPVGLASYLHAPLPAALVVAGVTLTLLLALPFTLGFAFNYSGPAFALSLLWVTTYRSSWGMVFHTDNLLTLHVLLLAISPAADVFSWDARRRGATGGSREASGRYGWALRAMCLVTVICYALAGVAKLKLAGLTWLGGELLRAHIAYDNLRKLELGSPIFPLGPWIVRQRSLFPGFALLTMVVELGAPLALLRQRLAIAWVVVAWGFHVSVALLMSIAFGYQLSFVAYAAFFPVEVAWSWLQRRLSVQAAGRDNSGGQRNCA